MNVTVTGSVWPGSTTPPDGVIENCFVVKEPASGGAASSTEVAAAKKSLSATFCSLS